MRHQRRLGFREQPASRRPAKMTLRQAKALLAPHGMTITKTDYDDYRVRPVGTMNPDAGYFTDDLDDAVRTGIHMAGQRQVGETPSHVADFNTLPEIIEHARAEGATHVVTFGSGATLYFPQAGGRYEEARLWRERGYWHAPAAGSRKVVDRLPQGAQTIESYLSQRGGRRAAEALRPTRWPDWEILDSIDRGQFLSPEAEGRAVKLAQLGFIDTTGTWRLTAKGRRTVEQRTSIAAEAPAQGGRRATESRRPDPHGLDRERQDLLAVLQQTGRDYMPPELLDQLVARYQKLGIGPAELRRRLDQGESPIDIGQQRAGESRVTPRRPDKLTMTDAAAKGLADDLAVEVAGAPSTVLPGGFRWGDKNASAQFTTYSPEYSQKVVVVVSLFEDGSVALVFFSDEGLNTQYENITHFLYGPGGFTGRTVDVKQMVEDINWVRDTVDGYAASWEQPGDEMEEARRGRRPPPDYSSRTAHAYNIELFYSGDPGSAERFAHKHESEMGSIIQAPLVAQGALRDGYRMEWGPIDHDDYRRLEGAVYRKLGNAVRVHLVQVMYAGGRVMQPPPNLPPPPSPPAAPMLPPPPPPPLMLPPATAPAARRPQRSSAARPSRRRR